MSQLDGVINEEGFICFQLLYEIHTKRKRKFEPHSNSSVEFNALRIGNGFDVLVCLKKKEKKRKEKKGKNLMIFTILGSLNIVCHISCSSGELKYVSKALYFSNKKINFATGFATVDLKCELTSTNYSIMLQILRI
jgi:hypothetical protein